MFSLVHPFLQTVTLQISWESLMFSRKPSNYDSHSKNRGNLGCFLRNRSKYGAILGSVSSIALSRRCTECRA